MPRIGPLSLLYSTGLLCGLLLLSLSAPLPARAQSDPGAREDEKAARQKLLRASDQIDSLQAALDSHTTQIADMKMTIGQQKADLDALRSQLATLKDENTALRAALAKLDAARADERKTLLDEVGKIVAENSKRAPAPTPPPSAPPKESAAASGEKAPDKGAETGFDYVVVKGDTLHAIAVAYQGNDVHVTVADLRKANGLGKDEAIHVGQKLFIPKK
ncbi:LysM domain-containing protein [Verrucomicrobium sp. GAS474]|uniref:LysM peptidoglycan-binding domain-containing protein n=1 Tax=Verrucomicrobium sp. GAS474 TaxID=1882831 RepID=UPI00087995A2|nr:LysM peptidoglycan-binding domain-containing protein [Verrucomicrobium sp. GAS474]SDT86766.1 LysM domain-containing protein [Verrucomicrobium sp. GAS474]